MATQSFYIAIPSSSEEFPTYMSVPSSLTSSAYPVPENINSQVGTITYNGVTYSVYMFSSTISYYQPSSLNSYQNSWLHTENASGNRTSVNTYTTSPPANITYVWTYLNYTAGSSYGLTGATQDIVIFYQYDNVYYPSGVGPKWESSILSNARTVYTITVTDNNVWTAATYSYTAGYAYSLSLNVQAEKNYDGVIICTSSHSSAGSSWSAMTSWSDCIFSGTSSVNGQTESSSTVFIPTSSGTLYIYFRTDGSGIYPSSGSGASLTIQELYKITLNDNGGTGGNGYTTLVMGSTSGSLYTSTVPTRGSFGFLGYYTTQSISGGNLYIGSTGSGNGSYEISSNITLYARWRNTVSWSPSTSVSTTYSTSQQAVSIGSSSATCASGGTVTYAITAITKSGSAQSTSGWSISGTTLQIPSSLATGSYNVSVTATSVSNSASTSGYTAHTLQKTITLTIIQGTITITLNKNGGSGGDSTLEVEPGAGSWGTSNLPTRSGYTFY